MDSEFLIIASDSETSFTMLGDGDPVEFSSLFEAARHARATSGCDNGIVVIRNESGKAMSRIPFNVT